MESRDKSWATLGRKFAAGRAGACWGVRRGAPTTDQVLQAALPPFGFLPLNAFPNEIPSQILLYARPSSAGIQQSSERAAELEIHCFIDKMSAHPTVCVKPNGFPCDFSGVCDENCRLLKEHSLLRAECSHAWGRSSTAKFYTFPHWWVAGNSKCTPWCVHGSVWTVAATSQACVRVCKAENFLPSTKINFIQALTGVKGQRGRVRDFSWWKEWGGGSGIWQLPVLP